MFGEIIKKFRVDNHMSQTNFVDVIQRSSENFSNLDVVTLSRWERGVTKPHLSRQNELLGLLGVDIIDVWDSLEASQGSSKPFNKAYFDGYVPKEFLETPDVIIINQSNSFLINNYLTALERILEFENNMIFNIFLTIGVSVKALFEKVINQYKGELTIVLRYEQLIGHLLRVDGDEMLKDIDLPIPTELSPQSQVIVSVNVTHPKALPPTIGKQAYRYLQNPSPNSKWYVFVNNRRMFDLLFSLDFEYSTLRSTPQGAKLMVIDAQRLRSKRVWMNILSEFKGN